MRVAVRIWIVMLLTISAVSNAHGDYARGQAAYDDNDMPRALQEWRDGARAGEGAAQLHLGALYEAGKGVPKNIKRAYYWYSLAAAAQVDGAANARDRVKAELTPQQVDEVQRKTSRFSATSPPCRIESHAVTYTFEDTSLGPRIHVDAGVDVTPTTTTRQIFVHFNLDYKVDLTGNGDWSNEARDYIDQKTLSPSTQDVMISFDFPTAGVHIDQVYNVAVVSSQCFIQ